MNPNLSEVIALFAAAANGVEQYSPAVTAIFEQISNYRNRRAHQRAAKAIELLAVRTKDLEASVKKLMEPENFDLFCQALKMLTDEEDERKSSFYSAFLELLLKNNHPREALRLVGEAVRGLTYTELEALDQWQSGPGAVQELKIPWLHQTLNARLVSFGLSESATSTGRFTYLGQVVRDIVNSGREIRNLSHSK